MIVSLIAESLSGRWGPTRARVFAWGIVIAGAAAIAWFGKMLWDNFAGGA